MLNIEDKIRNNREKFDHAEPSDGHFEKFESKVNEFISPGKKGIKRGFVLRVAAVILVFLAVSIVLLIVRNDVFKSPGFTQTNANEVPEELKEVQYYYTSLANEKLEQLDQMAENNEDVKKVKDMALNEMNELDETTSELEEEYKESGKNERIMNAIINNYRIMTDLLDHIIEELDQENQKESKYNQKTKKNEKIIV